MLVGQAEYLTWERHLVPFGPAAHGDGCSQGTLQMWILLHWNGRGQRCPRGRRPHEVGPWMTLLEPPRSQVNSVSFAGVETSPEDQAEEISVCPPAWRAWGTCSVADTLIILEDTPLLWPWPLHRAGGRRNQVTLEIEQRWQGVLLWYICPGLIVSPGLLCFCFSTGMFFPILGGCPTPVQPSNSIGSIQFPSFFPSFILSLFLSFPPSFSSFFFLPSLLLFNKYYLNAYHTPVVELGTGAIKLNKTKSWW